MKRISLKTLSSVFIFGILALTLPFFISSAGSLAQSEPAPLTIEITGINAAQLPTAVITTNVYDNLRNPISGLTADNFTLSGELADVAQIVSVENIADNNLPISVVLVIDSSSSMWGTPVERAKEAARVFVENLREIDSVAIIRFSNDPVLLQDFTSDRAALFAAIDSIQSGGVTALYDAATQAIQLADEAPTQRRVVVLLSDGYEDRGSETAGRNTAIDEARARGVSVYTIGFGSVDIPYLTRLAEASNAQFELAPNADELVRIYNELATRLRSQYVITLDAPLPLDGTEYDFELTASHDVGANSVAGVLRAPVPVPFIVLENPPEGGIGELTTLVFDVRADDPLTDVSFTLGDVTFTPTTNADDPSHYEIAIDPVALQPGEHTLTVQATDDDGETGTLEQTIFINSLTSQMTITPDISTLGEISEPLTLNVSTSGQTATTDIVIRVDGNTVHQVSNEADTSYTITPSELTAGEHFIEIEVINAASTSNGISAFFSVPALPLTFNFVGLEDGQEISEPTLIIVETLAQPDTAIANFSATVTANGQTFELESEDANLPIFNLDPAQYPPGDAQFTINVETDNGASGSQTANIRIAELPPTINAINGLEAGEIIEEDRTVTLDISSQTGVAQVSFSIDGQPLAMTTEAPYQAEIVVLDHTPGDHRLEVTVMNDGGLVSQSVPFVIGGASSIAATQIALDAEATINAANTQTAFNILATSTQAAADTFATSTQVAALTSEAIAQQTQIADATQQFVALETQNAQATFDADAAATRNIQSTATGEAVQQLGGTSTRQSAATNAQSTLYAQSTRRVESTQTAEWQETIQARATDTRLTATAQMAEARTLTAEVNAQGTLDARATVGALNAQASLEAQGTLNAQGTANAEASLTAQATLDAQAALDVQASAEAQASLEAQNTLDAQTALDTQATSDAQATIAAVTEEPTATEAPTEEVTEEIAASATADETAITQASTPQPRPSITPISTLTAETLDPQSPPTDTNLVSLLIGFGMLIIILVVLYLILTSRRRQRQK